MRVLVATLLLLGFGGICPVSAGEQTPFSTRFGSYEPVYFSVGWRDRINARFQLSFKYRFFEPQASSEGATVLLKNLYFSYTQTSLWDLESDSAPFQDTSYKPSLFYSQDLKVAHRGHPAISFRAGLGHESNGRDEEFSRSINFVFFQPSWRWEFAGHSWAQGGVLEGYSFTVAPKIHLYVGDLSDNPDIKDTRGIVDLHLDLEKRRSWKFSAVVRKGNASSYGSVLLNVSYPIDRLFDGFFQAYLHLQLFTGWGESILDYNIRHPSQYRLGLMIAR